MRRMRKISRLLAILVALNFILTGPVGVLAQAATVVIPKEQTLKIEILEDVDSGNNKEGDKIHFETRENLTVNGVVVIPYGTKGIATLDKVVRAGAWGKGGYFQMSFGSIQSINGVDVPVELGKAAQGAQNQTGVILPIVGAIVFLPLILFGFTKGKEAHIAANTQMYVNTRNDVDLGITADQAVAINNARTGAAPGQVPTVPSTVSGVPQPPVATTVTYEPVAPPPPTATSAVAQPPVSTASSATGSAGIAPPATAVQTGLNIQSIIMCKRVSKNNDPIGIQTNFPKQMKTLCLWMSFEKTVGDFMVETLWYQGDKKIRSKMISIPAGSDKASGTLYFTPPIPTGQWTVYVMHGNQAIKTVNFGIK